MAETPSIPLEFPEVPYERLAAYADSLRGLPQTREVIALWNGTERIRTEEDLPKIGGDKRLAIVLRFPLSGGQLSSMVDELGDHFDLATTGSVHGVEGKNDSTSSRFIF